MEFFMAYQTYIVNITFAIILVRVIKKYYDNFYSQCDKISKALEQTAEELKKIVAIHYARTCKNSFLTQGKSMSWL